MAQEQSAEIPQNTVTIEDVGPCKKKVTVEIPAEAVKKALDDQYRDLRRDAIVPGFRKGRAPRRLLEKRFGKETADQVKLSLLAESSDAALKDNDLSVLGDPHIDVDNIELPEEGPLTYSFEVEVWPEFELPSLEGIPVTKKAVAVQDEQVDAEIEQLRRYAGVWTPRAEGQAVEKEDQVIADVVLTIEGQEAPETLDNVEIHVREAGMVGGVPIENLEELLVGAQVGQTRETEVEVSKTFYDEQYRGKKVKVEIEVKDIKVLKPADLDENLFDRYGVDDEADLRQRIRDMLEGRLEAQVQADMADQISRYLLDNTQFELPLDVVAQQAGSVLQRQYIRLLTQGLSREQIEEHMETLRASSEQEAQEQLKTFFIMDKVSDQLGIEVSEEEVNGQIAHMALQRGQRPERMKEQMERDGSLSQLRLEVRQNKCIAKLLESAQITEVSDTDEAPKKAGGKKKASKKADETSDDKKD